MLRRGIERAWRLGLLDPAESQKHIFEQKLPAWDVYENGEVLDGLRSLT